MSRRLSEMAQARALARKHESYSRRALRSKMNPYNQLSRKPKVRPEDFQYNGVKTINDILFEFEQTIASGKQYVSKHRDKLLSRKAEISEETTKYWQQRIARGGIKF